MENRKLLIVGPLSSGHIQKWFENEENFKKYFFTAHMAKDINEKVFNFSFLMFHLKKIGFFLLIPFYIFTWWYLRPQVTNFHYLSSYGILALFTPKKNLILNVWGSDVNLHYNTKSKIKKLILKMTLKRFCYISAPAQHLKDKLIKMGASPDIIHVYQYGIDIYHEKSALNVTKEIKFVSNRNWQPLYNVDKIIKAFSLWCSEGKNNAHLIIFGSGYDEDNRNIIGIINSQSEIVRSKIKLIGKASQEEMFNTMSESDVYISIPQRDGTPLSLLEAMNLGLYPIVSDIDANREILSKDDGIFVSLNYLTEELIEAFNYCIKNNNYWDSIIKHNRMFVKNKHDRKINTKILTSKIEELMN